MSKALKKIQVSAEKISAPVSFFQPDWTRFQLTGYQVVKQHGLMIFMDGVIYAGETLINGADQFVHSSSRRSCTWVNKSAQKF